MLLGWLSDSDDKVKDDNKRHRRAHTEPGMGKAHRFSELKPDSRVSI